MESLYLLIPIGIVFVAIAIKILFWAINSGQYDNLDTEAHRILFDEQVVPKEQEQDASRPSSQTAPEAPGSDRPSPTNEAPKP